MISEDILTILNEMNIIYGEGLNFEIIADFPESEELRNQILKRSSEIIKRILNLKPGLEKGKFKDIQTPQERKIVLAQEEANHISSNNRKEIGLKILKPNLSEESLLNILIKDIASLQQKNRAIREEEDKYTIFLSEMLNRSLANFNYFTDIQDLSGKTEKSENKNLKLGGMGEVDLRFLNGNRELCHLAEALILDSIRTDYTKAHLKKIFDYDANGLPVNFMIVYSKVKDFYSLWQKYLNLVKEYEFEYPLIDEEFIDLSEDLSKYAGIKVGLTSHLRAGRICKLYHFFIDFN